MQRAIYPHGGKTKWRWALSLLFNIYGVIFCEVWKVRPSFLKSKDILNVFVEVHLFWDDSKDILNVFVEVRREPNEVLSIPQVNVKFAKMKYLKK